MPSPASRRCIAVPTPHSSETGLPARNVGASLRLRTVKPRGLSRSEAILARNLLSLNPIDTVMPCTVSTRLASLASSWAGQALVQSFGACEVEKGLVDRQGFEQWGEPMHLGPYLTSDSTVLRHVRPDNDRIRTGCQCLEHRHRRAHPIEPRHIVAGEHDPAGTTADDHRAVRQFGSVALFDGSIKRVAIDMCDRQRAEFGMAYQARRATGGATLASVRRVFECAAVTTQRVHGALPGGHNHAAPRTPLDAPWAGGSRGVATRSEKMYRVHNRGTCS
jgi:hypothetical protein